MANLINAGILPLTFENESDYDLINEGDELVLENVREAVLKSDKIVLTDKTNGKQIPLCMNFSVRQREMLLAGGLLRMTAKNS